MKTSQQSASCGGWLRLDRSVLNSFVNEKPESLSRYIDLLSLAAYQDTTAYVRGVTITLRRGEIAVSTTFLAHRWGVAQQSASRFLQRLMKHNLLERREEAGVAVYIIGSDAIEHYRKTCLEDESNERCSEGCKEECGERCVETACSSDDYNHEECRPECGGAAPGSVGEVVQYKEKEIRKNKSVVGGFAPTDRFLYSFFNTDAVSVGLVSQSMGVTVEEMKELAAETLAEWKMRGIEHKTETEARGHLVNQLRLKSSRRRPAKPKHDDWRRKRGQYTSARSWKDYDEPFV